MWFYFPCSIAHPSFSFQSVCVLYLFKGAFLFRVVVVVGYVFLRKIYLFQSLSSMILGNPVGQTSIILACCISFFIWWALGLLCLVAFLRSRHRHKRFHFESLQKKLVSY